MTDYGKTVKHRLIDLDKSQAWLLQEISKRTTLFVDSAYLAKILNGQRNALKIKAIINEVLDINE